MGINAWNTNGRTSLHCRKVRQICGCGWAHLKFHAKKTACYWLQQQTKVHVYLLCWLEWHLHALTPTHLHTHLHTLTHSPAHPHTHLHTLTLTCTPTHPLTSYLAHSCTVTATDFIQKLATAEKDHSNKLSQVIKEFRDKTKEKRWRESWVDSVCVCVCVCVYYTHHITCILL